MKGLIALVVWLVAISLSAQPASSPASPPLTTNDVPAVKRETQAMIQQLQGELDQLNSLLALAQESPLVSTETHPPGNYNTLTPYFPGWPVNRPPPNLGRDFSANVSGNLSGNLGRNLSTSYAASPAGFPPPAPVPPPPVIPPGALDPSNNNLSGTNGAALLGTVGALMIDVDAKIQQLLPRVDFLIDPAAAVTNNLTGVMEPAGAPVFARAPAPVNPPAPIWRPPTKTR